MSTKQLCYTSVSTVLFCSGANRVDRDMIESDFLPSKRCSAEIHQFVDCVVQEQCWRDDVPLFENQGRSRIAVWHEPPR